MNAPKFTPGPWSLLKAGTDECGEEHCFDYVQVAPHRYIFSEGRSEVEANANAALVAAAPDLFNALSVLADAAEASAIPVDAARAALAKAGQP
jgi:hypothetical protein